MIVLFDMDGVLVDFVRGSLRLHGRLDHVPFPDLRWDFPQQVGFEGTWVSDFWNPLGRDFWASLDPLPDGMELFRNVEAYCERYGHSLGLLSSPCNTAGCCDGKRDWVERHLPAYRKRTFLGSDKTVFASRGIVLLDDHDANVDAFRARGGRSVLIPRPWNVHRDECTGDGSFDVGVLMRRFLSVAPITEDLE